MGSTSLIILAFFVCTLVVAYFLWQAQGVVNEAAPEKHSADKNSSFQVDKYESSDFPVARGSGESEGITPSEAIARQKRAAVALVARLNQPSERANRFAILEELARRLSESPISDAALVLNGINAPILRREALARLAVARVAEEPEAALRLASSVIADKNHPVLSQLISSWATRNPQAAQAFVAQMQFGEMRQRASLALASTLAERDPNAAWQWAGAQPASWRASIMEAVITQIAEHQPALAAQFAVQITDPTVRRRSLAEVGAAMLEINSESALAWAKQLPAADSTETIAALADQLSYDNPKEALGIVAALPQGSTRSQAVMRVAGKLALQSPNEAAVWLAEMEASGEDVNGARAAVAWATADFDAPSAAALLAKCASIGTYPEHVEKVAGALATQDPKAAIAWAQSLESPQMSARAIIEVMRSWAGSDTVAAAAFVKNLPAASSGMAAAALLDAWAKTDVDAAIVFAKGFGADADALTSQALLSFAEIDPEGSANRLLKTANGRNSEEMHPTATRIVEVWVRSNPEAAAKWVQTLPPEIAGSSAMTLASQWAGTEPQSAQKWVSHLPPALRDAAVTGLVQTLAVSDPRNARLLADGITSAEWKAEALKLLNQQQ